MVATGGRSQGNHSGSQGSGVAALGNLSCTVPVLGALDDQGLSRCTLIIPQWHPATYNQLDRSVREKIRLKKLDREMIQAYVIYRKITKATGKRRLELSIVLRKGQRGADPDAYFKSLLDACVHAGILVDDSSRYVELAPVRILRGHGDWGWGTIITLSNIDPSKQP